MGYGDSPKRAGKLSSGQFDRRRQRGRWRQDDILSKEMIDTRH